MRGKLHRRLLAVQCLQLRKQPPQAGFVETGADTADVAQPASAALRQQQRTEAVARALGIGIADDDEIIAVLVLGLDPVAAAAAVMTRVRALADHAFVALRRRGGEHLRAMAEHVVAIGQHARRVAEQRAQQLLALQQRDLAQVHAGHAEQVEHQVAQRLPGAALDDPL